MHRLNRCRPLILFALLLGMGQAAGAGALAAPTAAATKPSASPTTAPAWVGPMQKVHERFTGRKGTFAQFGDSITVTLAYWADLPYSHTTLPPPSTADFRLVNGYLRKECWRDWKGPRFGSEGGQTIRWARKHVDEWLKELNPETALIMFGTNDLNSVPPEEYERLTREVVKRCLDNGTVVILSTIPPRSGKVEQSERFARIVRSIAEEMQVPLVDFHAEVTRRRPDDWDGSLPQFKEPADKNEYNVPTLISRDGVHPSAPKAYAGDYSEKGVSHNGYALRGRLTLAAYADVIKQVLSR